MRGIQLAVSATWHKFHQQFMCGFFMRSIVFHANDKKKPFSQSIFVLNLYEIFAVCQKSFEEFASDFAFFAICFLSKFNEIDTW
jgi:hypothetical protein